jgi:hypothetical protein
VLHSTQAYLQHRLEMIDYPYFQRRGYPIGSGSVESAHKQVVQRRLNAYSGENDHLFRMMPITQTG